MLINKSVFDDLGKYNEKYYYAQDYKLFTDMFMSKYRVKILKKVYYELNQENNISTNNKKNQNYYANLVKKEYKLF